MSLVCGERLVQTTRQQVLVLGTGMVLPADGSKQMLSLPWPTSAHGSVLGAANSGRFEVCRSC